MSESTNATTARLATHVGALPLRSLQLIGVFGTPEDRKALLRTSAGQIQQVKVGDKLRQDTIVAIDDDSLILSTPSGATRRVNMPDIPKAPAAA